MKTANVFFFLFVQKCLFYHLFALQKVLLCLFLSDQQCKREIMFNIPENSNKARPHVSQVKDLFIDFAPLIDAETDGVKISLFKAPVVFSFSEIMSIFTTSSSFPSVSGLIHSKKHHFGIQRMFPLPGGDSQLGCNYSLTHSALAGGAVPPIHQTGSTLSGPPYTRRCQVVTP